MEERVEFDINKALTSYDVDPATLEDAVVPVREAPAELLDCEDDPDSFTKDLLDRVLDPVVEAITESPDGITISSVFDTLRFILRWTSKDPAKVPVKVPTATLSQIIDLLTSAIDAEADAANGPLEAEDQEEELPHHKQILEMYAFLMRWTLMAVEKRTGEQPATTAAKGRGKGAKAKSSQKDDNWDPTRQLSKALSTLYKVLGLRLSRIFSTTIERDTFVGLITKPVWRILDNESRVKSVDIKQHCFRILCKAIKAHGQASNAQGMITQKLLDQEHLSEPLAEFLNILHREYAHPQLAEDVLKELSNRDFDSIGQKGEKGPKCMSIFLTKLAELNPEVVFKQMAMLQNLFDAKPHQLRNALIDACGYIIIMFSQQPIEGDNKKEMGRYIDLLEERCRDTNPYCRAKALKNLARLCEIEIIFQKFAKKRLRVAQVANLCLTHDSSHVRRHAIALLRKIIETHPYRMVNEGLLSSKEWNEQLLEVEAKINALKPEETSDPNEPTVDTSLLQDATQVENPAGGSNSQNQESEEEMARKAALLAENEAKTAELLEHKKYFCRVLDFIGIINDSADIIIQFFASKTKTEVIEAMDFFTLIDAYKVDNARKGIRRMLRLIWSKGTNEEGKSVQAHLIECYKNLYFTPPPNFDENNAANYLARNMISLTYLDTPAELTSLEELIRIMKHQGVIRELVIEKLWQVYGYQKRDTSKSQRRGAIMVLGMLALADPNIIRERMGICLRIGLGKFGRQDLGLARYTCIALRRISPSPGKQSAGASPESIVKLPNDHEVLGRLVAITEMITESNEWFGVAEQAISAIYVLAAQPDTLCSEIIRRKAKYVFSLGQRPTSSGSNASQRSQSHVPQDAHMQDVPMEDVEMKDAEMEDIKMEDVEMEDAPAELSRPPQRQNSAWALSQLLFIVGHVAIKQIVHLELCEQAYKRQKAEQGKKARPRESVASEGDSTAKRGRGRSAKAPAAAAEEADELDRMAGDDEEHFTETIAYIRENELLYDFRSALLSNFGRLVSDICANYTSYKHPTLQSQAALCLAKLMCVSERYCKENLQLLFDVLERSNDPVVRSNLVIAVGDMAIHFHHVIAEKSEFLFRRLNDRDPSVKRTCLMTLTFLILSSHVKVIKGQLGEMAKCLEDDDKRILDMARMFFNEYSSKDENNIYNQFMEMFSTLSADTELDEEAFQRIIKFIAKRVTKDKHQKQLAGKLASRLAKADTQRKWNDAAYAIGLLHPKDEEIRVQLEEGFKVVQTEA